MTLEKQSSFEYFIVPNVLVEVIEESSELLGSVGLTIGKINEKWLVQFTESYTDNCLFEESELKKYEEGDLNE